MPLAAGRGNGGSEFFLDIVDGEVNEIILLSSTPGPIPLKIMDRTKCRMPIAAFILFRVLVVPLWTVEACLSGKRETAVSPRTSSESRRRTGG